MKTEIFYMHEIPGFSDYRVDQHGTFYSYKSGKEVEKKVYVSKAGYCTIGLTPDGSTKQFRYKVHRIVALAWLPNPTNLPTVNHIDGNKSNNAVKNLEWVTHKQQIIHAYDTGLIKHHIKSVIQSDEEGNIIDKFNSLKEAAEKTGISASCISAVCKGKRRKTGGFCWYYGKDFKGQKMRKFGNCKKINQLDEDGEIVNTFESVTDAAIFVNRAQTSISDACTKGTRSGGYFWKLVEIEETSEDYKNWIILDEFPRYKISSDGRIYSLIIKRTLNPVTTQDKRRHVAIRNNDGILKRMYVHRLVAMAYLEKPDGMNIIDHIDNNPSNNDVSNLRWVNHSINGQSAYDTGANTNQFAVVQYDLTGKYVQIYKGVKIASESIGVSRTALSYALNGKTQTCKNFIWRYSTNTNPKQIDVSFLNKPRANMISISSYDEDGNLVQTYNGVKEASRIVGANCSSISICLKKSHRKCKGLYWRYTK